MQRFSKLVSKGDNTPSDVLGQKNIAVAEVFSQENIAKHIAPFIRGVVVQQLQNQAPGRSESQSMSGGGIGFNADQFSAIIRKEFAEQKEQRQLDILLLSVDVLPQLMRGLVVLQQRMFALQKLNESMFHDLCSMVRGKQICMDKYSSIIQYSEPVFSVPSIRFGGNNGEEDLSSVMVLTYDE